MHLSALFSTIAAIIFVVRCLVKHLVGRQYVLMVVKRLLYRRIFGPLVQLPGPEISRWTGLVSMIYWFRGQKPKYVHLLHDKYGV